MKLDPITTELINSRIRETTAAMAHALFHSGYSPILRESQDGTAGLCDAKDASSWWAVAAASLAPLHPRGRERWSATLVADMRDGDSFISNDPSRPATRMCPTLW
jgi:N-methylhydantoinase B